MSFGKGDKKVTQTETNQSASASVQPEAQSQHQAPEPEMTQQQQPNPAPQTEAPNPILRGMQSINAMMNPLLSGQSQEGRQIIQHSQEVLNQMDKTGILPSVKFHIATAGEVTNSFSAVVITVRHHFPGRPPIAVMQTLLLEKSLDPLRPTLQDINGQRIEVDVTPQEAYNQEYVNTLIGFIRKEYREPQLAVLDCGMQLITRETVIDSVEAVKPFLLESLTALIACLAGVNPQSQPLSIDTLNSVENAQVVAHTSVNENTHIRPNGIPVRTDITTSLTIQSGARSQIQYNSNREICRSSAYVDLVYTPPQTQMGYMQGPQPYFVPRITITQLSTGVAESPLEAILLGIANIQILGRNKAYGVAWRNGFTPEGETNLRDFGAVGLMAPVAADGKPAFIDVNAGDNDLIELMNRTLTQNPVYSIDIDQTGENSWLLQLFAQAAATTKAGKAARKRIIRAMDNLTGGRFSPLWRKLSNTAEQMDLAEASMIRDSGDKNIVGYYTHNGQRRDYRELDLLAMLNLRGLKDPAMVDEFCLTYASNEPILVRLARRKRILSSIVEGIVVKGYSTKYDFYGSFIQAMVGAIEDANFVVNDSGAGLRNNVHQHQSVNQWASVMVNLSNTGNQMFGGGNYQAQQQNGYQGQQMYQNGVFNNQFF